MNQSIELASNATTITRKELEIATNHGVIYRDQWLQAKKYFGESYNAYQNSENNDVVLLTEEGSVYAFLKIRLTKEDIVKKSEDTEWECDQAIDDTNEDNRPTHRVFYTPVGSDQLEFVMEGTLEECKGCAECTPYSFINEISSR